MANYRIFREERGNKGGFGTKIAEILYLILSFWLGRNNTY